MAVAAGPVLAVVAQIQPNHAAVGLKTAHATRPPGKIFRHRRVLKD